MKRILPNLLLILLLPISFAGRAQVSDSAIIMHIPRVDVSFSVPAGDLAERFGVNSGIGASYLFKNSKQWIFGAQFEYLFGGNVKQEVAIFDNITASNGSIIDASGSMALMDTYERGFSVTATFGKLLDVWNTNPNSGLLLTGGIGYLTHHIRTEVYLNLAPQVYDDYADGYDRLSGGPVYNLFAGYLHVDPQNIFNYYVGVDFKHAMTKPLRNYQFDLKGPEPDDLRHDIFIGIKAGWMLPLYRRKASSYYYY